MGKCSIPRSNPGGGAERVGDIKVTTRTSLGNKWVLCNGDPMPGSTEVAVPDITDINNWTNVNGLGTIYGDPTIMSRAAYAGDGIWYITQRAVSTNVVYVIFEYNQNTGSTRIVYHYIDNIYIIPDNNYIYTFYDKDTNSILFCAMDNTSNLLNAIMIGIFDISTSTLKTTILRTGTNTANSGVFGSSDISSANNFPATFTPLYFKNGIFYYGVAIEAVEGMDWSNENQAYETTEVVAYQKFVVEKYDISTSTFSFIDVEGSGGDGIYIHNSCEALYINNKLYVIDFIHNVDMAALTCCIKNITDNITVVGTDWWELTGSGIYTNIYVISDGESIIVFLGTYDYYYAYIYNTISNDVKMVSIDDLYPPTYNLNSIFYLNGIIYVALTDSGSDFLYGFDSSFDYESRQLFYISNMSGLYNYFCNIQTTPENIRTSQIIHTSYANDSDNYYFFDGRDQTPRLPVITVDEEAYCFMKIKE